MASTPAWTDPDRWKSLRDGSDCPICHRGGPLDVIATTWVSAGSDAPLPGYACVVSKRHVVEPFELTLSEQAAFWSETMATAEALAEVVQPVKMNYEIHGNVVPHLHVHLYPRFQGDPYGTGALQPRTATYRRSESELDRLVEAVRAAAERLATRSRQL